MINNQAGGKVAGARVKKVEVYIGDEFITRIPEANIQNIREHYHLRGLEHKLRIIDPDKLAKAEQDRETILKLYKDKP
jgi:hypothetical protein